MRDPVGCCGPHSSRLVLLYTVNPVLPRLLLLPLLVAGCSGGNRPALERTVNAVTAPRASTPPRRTAPDASFMNLKWGSLHLAPGGTTTAELDVVNRGEQATGPFRVAVYATPGGSVVTANKTLLGSTDVASLVHRVERVVVTITAPVKAGSYAVGVEIDDLRQVPGDERNNNTSGAALLIVK